MDECDSNKECWLRSFECEQALFSFFFGSGRDHNIIGIIFVLYVQLVKVKAGTKVVNAFLQVAWNVDCLFFATSKDLIMICKQTLSRRNNCAKKVMVSLTHLCPSLPGWCLLGLYEF